MNQNELFLSNDVNGQLDLLLAQWQDQYRLSDIQARTIRDEIVFSEVELSEAWWQNYVKTLSTVVTKTTRFSNGFLQKLSNTHDPLSPGWPAHDSSDWQPYLKLAS